MKNHNRRNQSNSLQRAQRRWRRPMADFIRREGRLSLWFASTMAGVLAKSFFEASQAGRAYTLGWPQIAIALVATLVTFHATFERYQDVRRSTPLLVQVCLAFQCGFFWQTVFNDLTGMR